MTGLPDFVSTRAYDAAQGRDTDDDFGEETWIIDALNVLHKGADKLASVEHSNGRLTDECHDVATAIWEAISRVKAVMP